MLVAARTGAATRETDDDCVADGEAFDTFADRLDHPRAFMAEHAGQCEGRELVAEDQVGVAEADARNPHTHLARARRFDLDRLDREIAAGLTHHGRRRFGHHLLRSVKPAPFLLAIVARRHAEPGAKGAAEMALAGEARRL